MGHPGRKADKGRKRAVNLSVDGDLVDRARGLGVNLSRALEEKLTETVREAEAKAWRERNKGALEDHKAFVEKYGIFSEGRRLF